MPVWVMTSCLWDRLNGLSTAHVGMLRIWRHIPTLSQRVLNSWHHSIVLFTELTGPRNQTCVRAYVPVHASIQKDKIYVACAYSFFSISLQSVHEITRMDHLEWARNPMAVRRGLPRSRLLAVSSAASRTPPLAAQTPPLASLQAKNQPRRWLIKPVKRQCCAPYQKAVSYSLSKGSVVLPIKRQCYTPYQKAVLYSLSKGSVVLPIKRQCCAPYQKAVLCSLSKGSVVLPIKRQCCAPYQKAVLYSLSKGSVVLPIQHQ
jgi:hypothetical protein